MKHGSGYRQVLGFTDAWLDLGIVSDQQVERLGRLFDASDDKNPEHYRYRAFREYLATVNRLAETQAAALYELGRSDPDPLMGAAMMHDVVSRPDCPEAVREGALASGAPHLVKLVCRIRLVAALAGGVTEPLMDRVLASRDGSIQREVVERFPLSRGQLERLTAAGANRAVGNLAAVRLRKGAPAAASEEESDCHVVPAEVPAPDRDQA
jgi:hypothetical protein